MHKGITANIPQIQKCAQALRVEGRPDREQRDDDKLEIPVETKDRSIVAVEREGDEGKS